MSIIELSYNNGEESFELPILPEKIEVKEAGNNQSHELMNVGEITVINQIKAPTLQLEGVFPAVRGPYVTSDTFYSPRYYVDKIKEWRSNGIDGWPIRLKVLESAIDINWACTIEDFSYREEAGAVGDIAYKLEIKEYRWYPSKRVYLKEEFVDTGDDRPLENTLPSTYTVVSGDTLFGICKRLLGDGSLYKEVASKNGITNPNLIYPGQVLEL